MADEMTSFGKWRAVVGGTLLVVPLVVGALGPRPNAAPGSLPADSMPIDQRIAARRNTDARISGPGTSSHSFTHDGRTRRYLVHVPKSHHTGSPAQIVIAMHGGGGSMSYQANDENYRLISKSESSGFVAVFPNGISPLPSGLLATWNAGRCCGNARDRNVDDVGFIRRMIARINQDLPIDPARVFGTGMSNGALMAYRLACEMPDTIRGIMAVAGTDNTTDCTPSRPVPVLHVHARNDDHVLYDGGAGPAARDLSVITRFTSVPATIKKWVALNRASTRPTRVLEVPGAWCDLYEAGAGGAPVKLCVTDTGGHSWPGGTKRRAEDPPSSAISATDLMWEFWTGVER